VFSEVPEGGGRGWWLWVDVTVGGGCGWWLWVVDVDVGEGCAGCGW